MQHRYFSEEHGASAFSAFANNNRELYSASGRLMREKPITLFSGLYEKASHFAGLKFQCGDHHLFLWALVSDLVPAESLACLSGDLLGLPDEGDSVLFYDE